MKPCKSKERTITILFLNTIFSYQSMSKEHNMTLIAKATHQQTIQRRKKEKKKEKAFKVTKRSIKFCTNKNRRIRSMSNEPLSSKYDKIISILVEDYPKSTKLRLTMTKSSFVGSIRPTISWKFDELDSRS